ncbi:Hpt domain-containing protein [Alteromonas sp. a30]|uniref:Hpt domain-containing protein n=1 Tax=Alteromonas sp. a30 TaxID=2730917 RepID=UPI00227E0C0B|nr:Hpt domain-containing protein [Alteromonas sp. a30]MCY7296584.1 Hpt domain-containing protein [Alteromonas sp. a30]
MTNKNIILDLDFGLSQLSGNKELLIKMFERFRSDYAQFADELYELLATNDTHLLRQKVHTIKGVAGNLGMNALYYVSKEFEEAAKTDDPNIASHLLPFKETLEATIGEMNELIEGVHENTSDDDLAQGVDRLKQLLRENEFISKDDLAAFLANSDYSPATKSKISQAINDLDYPTALSLL